MNKNKGFTLMELMIVIAIIMILAGAIVARVSTSGEKARIAKATAECEEIASACRAFYTDTGYWPGRTTSYTDSGLIEEGRVRAYADDGTTVITGSAPNWNGPYLEAESWPEDPWENTYGTIFADDKIYATSKGPDGDRDFSEGSDDIKTLIHRFQ